jgi:carbon-monoxide dehydrogenase large subunit
MTEVTGQGVGARVRRKEDSRFLRGRGNYVSDMILPGQSEVSFLRSPIAHGRIRRITKPADSEGRVFVRSDLAEASTMAAATTVPGYKVSGWHPLAHEKVRFVGEPVVMCVAPTRAEAEDLSEQVEVEYDELPVLIDALAAREEKTVRLHEQWGDNLFLTLNIDNGYDANAKDAPVVVKREISLNRHAMVPMEGKAILAYWDERVDQLVVYYSTQVPHVVRVGLAQFLGLDHGQVRVISPDVGGGFGYKVIVHPEELCVAWLALKYRRPFRYIEDRREHLVAGANTREHHYRLTAHADKNGRLLALDAEITIDGGAYSNWPFTAALEPGQATGNLPGPYDFRGYRCKTHCVATNKPGFMPYRGVARTGVCFAMELTMDAIARAVGREPWEVRYDNLVPASAMPYDNVTRKHYDSGDYQKALLTARDKIGLTAWRERQRKGPMAVSSASASRRIASRPLTAPACFPAGACRSCRATTRRRFGWWPTAGSRFASACIRTARAWKPPWRRSPMRSRAFRSKRSGWFSATPAPRPIRPAPTRRAASSCPAARWRTPARHCCRALC